MTNLFLIPQATVEVPPSKQIAETSASSTSSATRNTTLQSDMQSVFESYAALYPNPRLAQERQNREELIRAVVAAGNATELNPKPAPSKSFWGRLFGGGNRASSQSETQQVQNFDESCLKYVESDSPEHHGLCGTQNYSLDVSCIPPEAYMMARFLVASRHRRTNVARNSWYRAGSVTVIIAGLGQIVELRNGEDDDASLVSTNHISSTSDRWALEQFVQREGLEFDPNRARGCLVGPCFMMVSWGLPDGIVVCYRKAQHSEKPNVPGWQAVARIGPAQVVQSNLTDFLSEDNGSIMSPLLTVTDVAPLVVETGPDAVPDVSLALSRLGGYIEIVPLPSHLWYGAEIQPQTPSRSKKGLHYAVSLKDLTDVKSIAERILSIPTLDYHGDIMGLEALRTRVKDDTVWDQGLYPDRPPSEHILIAHGCDMDRGTEQLSFWAVSTLFSAQSDPKEEIGFSLHATLAEAIDVGPLVPPVTIFANDAILEYWRKPRHVELRDPGDPAPRTSDEEKQVTTIQILMPLLAVCSSRTSEGTLLTMLDAFGGVTLLNCSLLERLVSQCLSEEEHQQVFSSGDAGGVPLADFLYERTQTSETLSSATDTNNLHHPLSVQNVQFLPNTMAALFGYDGPVLALLTKRRLYLVSMREFRDRKATVSILLAGAEKRNGDLYVGSPDSLQVLLSGKTGRIIKAYSLSCPGNVSQVVQQMLRDGKDREAVKAAESLNASDKARLEQQLDASYKRAWRSHGDLDSLFAVQDHSYQLQQVLAASEGKVQVFNAAEKSLDLLRLGLKRIIDKLKKASLSTTLAVCGTEGVESTISLLRQRYISLGSYEFISQQMSSEPSIAGFAEGFLPVPIPDIARAFARQGDWEVASVLHFRHFFDIGNSIIESIPLDVDISYYRHLLPIPAGQDKDTLLFLSDDDDDFKTMDTFDTYLREHIGTGACISEEDRAVILSEMASVVSRGSYHETGLIERALLERAERMQLSCGSLNLTAEFCGSALKCIQQSAGPDSEVVRTLQTIEMNSLHLAELLGSFAGSDVYLSDLATMSTADFGSLDASALSLCILKLGLPPTALLVALNDHVRPKLSSDPSDMDEEFESTITDTCRQIVISCSDHEELIRALSSVCAVCQLSRSSLPKTARVLKGRARVLEVIFEVLRNLAGIPQRAIEPSLSAHRIMDLLWKMYECVPVSRPRSPSANEKLDDKADYLRLLLILGDVVSRWADCDFLSLLHVGSHGAGDSLSIDLRDKAVRELCQAGTDDFFSNRGQANVHGMCNLAETLIYDIKEVLSISFAEGSNEILTVEFFLPLLQRTQVPVLRHLLMVFGVDLFSIETAQAAVISFTSDAVFSSEEGQNVEAAIACEDSLGEFFPALESHFQSIRQCLNAAHFVNSVIFSSIDEYVRPDAIKKSRALDVVHSVLAKNPDSVLKDCEEWEAEEFGVRANRHFREVEKEIQVHDEFAKAPPRLPGVAIFHLASLLGLVDMKSAILVKSLVIGSFLESKHFGAAAAVCRMFFSKKSSNGPTGSESAVVLRAIAALINAAQYNDSETKLELARKALIHLPTSFGLSNDCDTSSVVAAFPDLLREETCPGSNYYPLTMLPETAALDISGFLLQFLQLSTSSEVDNSLIDVIGKQLLKAFTTKLICRQDDSSMVHVADLIVLLDLGLSVLCHSNSAATSLQTLAEIEVVLESSREVFDDREYRTAEMNADERIVQGLVGMGYSEIGARRAAIMTGNADFNEALNWAVSNSHGPSFNDPMMILKTPTAVYDVKSYHLVFSKINATKKILAGRGTFEDPVSGNSHEIIVPGAKGINNPVFEAANASYNAPPIVADPPPPDLTFPKGTEAGNSSSASFPGFEMGYVLKEPIKSPYRIPANDRSTKRSMPPLGEKTTPMAPDGSNFLKSTNKVQGKTSSKPRSSISTASGRPPARLAIEATSDPASRIALRQMGLEALNEARATTQPRSPQFDERSRLIEEGRRLLDRSRPRSEKHPNGTPSVSKVTFAPLNDQSPPNQSGSRYTNANGANLVNGPAFAKSSPKSVESDAPPAESSGWDFDEETEGIDESIVQSSTGGQPEDGTHEQKSSGWGFDDEDGLDAIDSAHDGWDFDD